MAKVRVTVVCPAGMATAWILVSRLLAPHKRPRVVRYLTSLPRNDMGKVMKRALNA